MRFFAIVLQGCVGLQHQQQQQNLAETWEQIVLEFLTCGGSNWYQNQQFKKKFDKLQTKCQNHEDHPICLEVKKLNNDRENYRSNVLEAEDDVRKANREIDRKLDILKFDEKFDELQIKCQNHEDHPICLEVKKLNNDRENYRKNVLEAEDSVRKANREIDRKLDILKFDEKFDELQIKCQNHEDHPICLEVKKLNNNKEDYKSTYLEAEDDVKKANKKIDKFLKTLEQLEKNKAANKKNVGNNK